MAHPPSVQSAQSGNYSANPDGPERIAAAEGGEGMEQADLVLAEGGEVAADAAEGLDAFLAAEATRDLLLQLDQAQIALGLVVVERHAKVEGEAQHVSGPATQPAGQVAGLGALGPADLAGGEGCLALASATSRS